MDLWQPGSPETLRATASAEFTAAFGGDPHVVGRAPGRVNLIGEHTDYNSGLCLPVALPHATYAAIRPSRDGLTRLLSSDLGETWEGRLAEVGPGRVAGWPAYVAGVLWALRADGMPVPEVEIALHSTVPLGAGLSSSAAVECAVAVAVTRLAGLEVTDERRERLARACMRAESEVAGAPTGGMDQTVSLFARSGAALLLDFADGGRRAVDLGLATAGLALLVIDTRVSHALVDGGYAARRADCERAAEALGHSSLREADLTEIATLPDERIRRRARHVVTEIQRVTLAVEAFAEGDWARLGGLFAASHASLRDDFEVSCPELDLAVAAALAAGARGARMTGGGFGGSAIALVDAGQVGTVGRSVADAFAEAGYTEPRLLVAEPSAGAD